MTIRTDPSDMPPGDRWFFDRIAPIYDMVMPAVRGEALRAGFAVANGPINRVVDLGGGTGRASKAITADEQVVIDASSGMLQGVPADIDRVLGSGTDLPLEDGVADAVVLVDALHHFPQHHRVLTEVFRVLRAGGVLVIRDFNRSTIRGRLLEFGEHLIRMESTFRTPSELIAELGTIGFDPDIIGSGFTSTVVGYKPGRPWGGRPNDRECERPG